VSGFLLHPQLPLVSSGLTPCPQALSFGTSYRTYIRYVFLLFPDIFGFQTYTGYKNAFPEARHILSNGRLGFSVIGTLSYSSIQDILI
jgi:hypothetical protein